MEFFLELVVSGGSPVLLVSFATTMPLVDSKNDNQCKKKRFFFLSTTMHD